jgi:hypothetical protein
MGCLAVFRGSSPAPLLKPSDARSRNTGAKRPGKDPGVLRRHRDVPSENPLRPVQSEGIPQRLSLRGAESGASFFGYFLVGTRKYLVARGRNPANTLSPAALASCLPPH